MEGNRGGRLLVHSGGRIDPSILDRGDAVRANVCFSSILGAVLLSGGSNARSEPRAAPSAQLPAFEAALASLAQKNHLPGLSAAIVQDQTLIWSQGFGFADLERKIPAAPDTPYRLASVTKPFAAVLIMQLVEKGATAKKGGLALDTPMREFAIHPWFEPGG